MLIHKDYSQTNTQEQSDEKYLLNQLWLLKHVFYDEIAAVLNADLQYLGISNKFANVFNCNSEILGHKFSIYTDNKLISDLDKSEQRIIKEKIAHDSVYQIKQGNEVKLYLIRKRPIVNPVTANCVGMFIFVALLNLATHSNIIYRIVSGQHYRNQLVPSEELSDEQHQIIACLLMGFHQRKEIASILQNVTNKEYSERQIKYFLSKLYQKYNCSSITELITLIINSHENDLKLPAFNSPDLVNEL